MIGKMTQWHFSAIIAVLCICGSHGVSEEESNEFETSVFKLSNGIFQEIIPSAKEANPCKSDSDCRNGAKCITDSDGISSCYCKNGTYGDICEIVGDCKKAAFCKGNDVSCEYNEVREMAYCKCENSSMRYDRVSKKCRVPCENYDDCGRYGNCYSRSDGTKFCGCKKGVSGYFCEVIDQCESKEVTCGDDPYVTCSLGPYGKAFCNCLEYGYGYDYDNNTCRECSCEKTTTCNWRNGKKTCMCDMHRYYWDGYECQECPCGWGYACKLTAEGKMVCDCPEHAAQRENLCVDCYCGKVSFNCSFSGLDKVCACKPGYFVGENNQCQNANPCKVDSDCRNGASCRKDYDGINSCHCKKGTSGDACEIVDDCKNASFCKGNDVSCEYDQVKQKAYCKCENSSKSYDLDWEMCRVPCKSYGDCGRYGYCLSSRTRTDGIQFCDCKLGASGDLCDIVDQCERKEVTCGDDPYVTCSLGPLGKAFCNCLEYGYGYDYDSNTCRKCSCENATTCNWRNGKETCMCDRHMYYWDGYECRECPCGWGYACKLSAEGKMVCACPEHTAQRENSCANCDCGEYSFNCSFSGLDKVCACKPGYAVGEYNQCRRACNATQPCQNGGTCDKTCKCPEGIRGDFCQRVGWCEANYCGEGLAELSECVYDPDGPYPHAYCRCKLPKYIFHVYKEKCIECDCGDHGNCSLNSYYGTADCKCEEGYEIDYESHKCKKCDCGPNSNCFFDGFGRKRCSCNGGYNFMKKGDEQICTRCDCGPHGYTCKFDDSGRKLCYCSREFISRKGSCITKEDCDCKTLEDTTCSFGEDGWGEKKCECPKGYRFDKDVCEDINECTENTYDCPRNAECFNTEGSYECRCKRGFEENRYGIERYGCDDIDECKDRYACQYSSVRCINTIGSYKCECKYGLIPGTDYNSGVYETRDNWCYKKVSPFRLASQILGGILGAIIGIQLIVIIYRRCK